MNGFNILIPSVILIGFIVIGFLIVSASIEKKLIEELEGRLIRLMSIRLDYALFMLIDGEENLINERAELLSENRITAERISKELVFSAKLKAVNTGSKAVFFKFAESKVNEYGFRIEEMAEEYNSHVRGYNRRIGRFVLGMIYKIFGHKRKTVAEFEA